MMAVQRLRQLRQREGLPLPERQPISQFSVNGTDYLFSEAFTAADLPEGYTETKLHSMVKKENLRRIGAGVCIGYLVDSAGTGKLFPL